MDGWIHSAAHHFSASPSIISVFFLFFLIFIITLSFIYGHRKTWIVEVSVEMMLERTYSAAVRGSDVTATKVWWCKERPRGQIGMEDNSQQLWMEIRVGRVRWETNDSENWTQMWERRLFVHLRERKAFLRVQHLLMCQAGRPPKEVQEKKKKTAYFQSFTSRTYINPDSGLVTAVSIKVKLHVYMSCSTSAGHQLYL